MRPRLSGRAALVAAVFAAVAVGACSRGERSAREAPKAPADTSPPMAPSTEIPATGAASPAPSADTTPTGIASPSDVHELSGMYVYLADAARFTDCATGASYPVAQDAAAAGLERAYLDARGGPGEPVFVAIRGRVAPRPGMEGGTVDAVVIDSVESMSTDRGCGGNVPDRPLEGTQWVLADVTAAPPVPGGARATLRLDPEEKEASGSTGCSPYSGTYRLTGGQLDIEPTQVTGAACSAPLVQLQVDFLEALRVTGSYRVRGDTLELLGEAGVVARLVGAR